jgi:hypothetical protein
MVKQTIQYFPQQKSNSLFFRSSFYASLFIFALPTLALADVVIHCPARDELTSVTLSFSSETLVIKDDLGSTMMPATFNTKTGKYFGIVGSGPMVSLMPDLAEFDKCLTAKLKEHETTAADKDMLFYVQNTCRLMLLTSAKPQKTDAAVNIISIEPKIAMVTILTTYLKPSEVAGQPLEIGNILPRDCTIVSGP